jgi:hypothetical protein
LSQKQPARELYLAIPSITHETFFKLELIKIVIQSQNIKLLIYNPEQEAIKQWIR